MDWKDAIKEIDSINQDNRLVIFVGSGVSKNSGIPTWYEFVKGIAQTIGYESNKCEGCKKEEECLLKSDGSGCKALESLSTDELLKIPEYLYNLPNDNHKTYKNYIEEYINRDYKSNELNKAINEIDAHHIITTNYDSLIEDEDSSYLHRYTVIKKDDDLVSNASDRYIIKMHGDKDVVDSIVLRETDYLYYEQNHPVISIFIKSLLINHSFMFIGYSLNDYNLNLIMAWINYHRDKLEKEISHRNYFVTADSFSEYEKNRLSKRNIEAIDLNTLPDTLVDRVSCGTLEDERAKRLYTFLKCLNQPGIFDETLYDIDDTNEKSKTLNTYKYISVQDLPSIRVFNGITLFGSRALLRDKSQFDKIRDIYRDNEGISEVLSKTMISNIDCGSESLEISSDAFHIIPLYAHYINNDYIRLMQQVDECANPQIKIYYYNLMGLRNSTVDEAIIEDEKLISKNDYIGILMHKIRKRLSRITLSNLEPELAGEINRLINRVPFSQKQFIEHLSMIFYQEDKLILRMESILEKVKERYRYNNNTLYFNACYSDILKLQGYAYNHYYFFKINNIPLDGYTETKRFFKSYIEAILCSNSIQKQGGTVFNNISNDNEPYSIEEVDLDIIVKYSTKSDIDRWIKDYPIENISVSNSVNIVEKYCNLSSSHSVMNFDRWKEQVYIFTILIHFVSLGRKEKSIAFKSISDAICSLLKEDCRVELFIDILSISMKVFNDDIYAESYRNIGKALLSRKDIVDVAKSQRSWFVQFSKVLSRYTDEEQIGLVENILNDKSGAKDQNYETISKAKKAYYFRHFLPLEYNTFFSENINFYSSTEHFCLFLEKRIEFNDEINDKIKSRLINALDSSIERKSSGISMGYDDIGEQISFLILYKLLGMNIENAILKKYRMYSDYVEFIINPETFDYSKVDTDNYMWENLIFSKEYRRYFKKHKKEILNDNLKAIFRQRKSSIRQEKVVYGVLLNQRELSEIDVW